MRIACPIDRKKLPTPWYVARVQRLCPAFRPRTREKALNLSVPEGFGTHSSYIPSLFRATVQRSQAPVQLELPAYAKSCQPNSNPSDVHPIIRTAAQAGRGAHEGQSVNPKLKQLMKELGEAINESLSESEQIAEVIAKIKAGGYDVFLVLEATIGFNKTEDEARPMAAAGARRDPEFKVNPQDMKFLKSLKISLDDAA